jgi:hypothetical protein
VSQSLIESFVGTLDGEGDVLGIREDAAGWLHTAGVLPPESGLTGGEHAALLRLRQAIRDMRSGPGSDRGEAAARLTRALADGRLVLTVDAAGGSQLASAARSSFPSVVAAFAIAIAAGDWQSSRGTQRKPAGDV